MVSRAAPWHGLAGPLAYGGPSILAFPSASEISSETHGSDSPADRCARAATAEADPTLPNAQAACPRTSGSGSDKEEVSTGTASGEAQLPSPTQRLRANPARPALRIAEPRENDSQEDSSSAVSNNSISDGDSVPGCEDEEPGSGCTLNGGSPGERAAYPGSDACSENLRVNGHTS